MKIVQKMLAVLAFAIGATSCNAIDEAVDCAKICNRYKDCFDENYDVDGCIDRCHDVTTEQNDAADDCEACIDDRSCSGSVFPCAAECAVIVAE